MNKEVDIHYCLMKVKSFCNVYQLNMYRNRGDVNVSRNKSYSKYNQSCDGSKSFSANQCKEKEILCYKCRNDDN